MFLVKYEFVVVFLFINFVNIDITFAKCRLNVPAMQNLQLKRMSGLWYPVETDDPSVNARKGCDTFNVTYSNSVEKGESITAFLTSNEKKYERFTLYSVNGTGRLKIQNNGNRKIADLIDGWLISSDYVNYSMWYVCNENSKDPGYKYIGLRERPPKMDIVKQISSMFISLGFDLTDLRSINQINC
nr:uncharacterized protein LOC111421529 [Onthophagus taurus]